MDINAQNKNSALMTLLAGIGQSLVVLVVLGGVAAGLYQGTFILVARAGLELSFATKFGVWYAVGMLCALFWPWKYRKNLDPRDIKSVALFAPLAAVTGPLALLLCIPL